MIAASARVDQASTVASADAFVALGGFAENPMRNVRLGRFGPGGVDTEFLHSASTKVTKATRTLLPRTRTLTLAT
jgi:hypothetical protein